MAPNYQTMSGVYRSPSYKRSDQLARHEPSNPSKTTVCVNKVASAVSSLFGNNNPIKGKTPEDVIVKTADDLKSGFPGRDNDIFSAVKVLKTSSEGEILLMKSQATGRYFIAKYTFPAGFPGLSLSFPNETMILAHHLFPHPNLVSIFETFTDEENYNRYMIWMEFCAGGNLLDQMELWMEKRHSIVPEVFLLHVIVELTSALAYIHHGLRYSGDGKYTEDEQHHAVIHCDVKDENVFLRWPSNPAGGLPDIVLGDFGIARLANDKVTKLNPGTFEFHAPEDQAVYGDAELTRANAPTFAKVSQRRERPSDIYALGLIICMMASGKMAVRKVGKDPRNIEICKMYETPGVRDFVILCLALDSSRRATASFHEVTGILPLVGKLRKARDEMIKSQPPLERSQWQHPPGEEISSPSPSSSSSS